MKGIMVHEETALLLERLKDDGESWDASIRRWAGLPARVSLRRVATPKPIRTGQRGRKATKYGWFYAEFAALQAGQHFVAPYLGQRSDGGRGPFPPQPELLTAYRRAEQKALALDPGATFTRLEDGTGYFIKRLT